MLLGAQTSKPDASFTRIQNSILIIHKFSILFVTCWLAFHQACVLKIHSNMKRNDNVIIFHDEIIYLKRALGSMGVFLCNPDI